MDLGVEYLGIPLRSPLVAAASAVTGDLGSLKRLEDAGAGAVVLPPVFEEDLDFEDLHLADRLETWADSYGEAPGPLPSPAATLLDAYLERIARARAALSIPVLASLNGTGPGAWVDHAKRMEEAGAHALELAFFTVPADPTVDGPELEARFCELVAHVRRTVSIPLAVKLTPFLTAPAHTAHALVAAGADGLVLFHRTCQPFLDTERLEVVPKLSLSQPGDAMLAVRWIAILRGRVAASLAATGGLHSAEDVLRVLLAGADVALMGSALVRHGPEHLRRVTDDLARWAEARGYASVRQLTGSVSQEKIADPSAFERTSYVNALKDFLSAPLR